MKSLASIILLGLATLSFAQQKESFDIATYTVPADWKKTNNTNNVISYAITNNLKGTYCQIGIYASTTSKGSLQADFESEWETLVVKTYKPSTKPELVPSTSENGWQAQGGTAPFEFNGGQSIAMLVTMSGYNRCVSIVILTNTVDYQSEIEKFLDSVDLIKIETTSKPTNSTTENTPIVGIWTMTSSDQSSYRVNNGVMNYIVRQYTLNENDTYSFITKTFDPLMDKILLRKENGIYQINANNIIITPQKSVLEAWSKKDGADEWGNLLNTQNIPLEIVTYQFTKHYFSGIDQWSLVLQSDKATQRDGSFSSNSSFSNAYYYSPISPNHPVIEYPGSQVAIQETEKPLVSSPAIKSSFAFNTTNFDDGWTSTVHEDWIEVTKGNIKVLIHYPNKSADAYNSVVLDGLKNAWNILVAPRYSSASNFEFKPIMGWQTIEFAEADAIDNETSKSVHVVLFKMNYSNGSGKYLEFITPDKRTYEQEFGVYQQKTYGWEKVEAMANYNKFAVAATDLNGTWTNNFSGMIQYVNAYTGYDAGANTHASSESFYFKGDTYHWEIGVASGMVGNIKFQNAKSDGKINLPNNWQIHFSDLEGKPRTYNAYFSCIKGARLLWLEDSASANGYSGYGKKD